MDIFEIFEEIRDDDSLLNDRREYSIDDLQSAYGLDQQEASDLQWLIANEIDPDHIFFDALPAEGIKAFVQDALHGNLDGWEAHDKIVILQFIDDIAKGANEYGR
jgi:hypothetical protein